MSEENEYAMKGIFNVTMPSLNIQHCLFSNDEVIFHIAGTSDPVFERCFTKTDRKTSVGSEKSI